MANFLKLVAAFRRSVNHRLQTAGRGKTDDKLQTTNKPGNMWTEDLRLCRISGPAICISLNKNSTGSPDVLLVKLIYKQLYVCEVTSKINCKEVRIFIK